MIEENDGDEISKQIPIELILVFPALNFDFLPINPKDRDAGLSQEMLSFELALVVVNELEPSSGFYYIF